MQSSFSLSLMTLIQGELILEKLDNGHIPSFIVSVKQGRFYYLKCRWSFVAHANDAELIKAYKKKTYIIVQK